MRVRSVAASGCLRDCSCVRCRRLRWRQRQQQHEQLWRWRRRPNTLTIYSSLPLQGDSRPQSRTSSTARSWRSRRPAARSATSRSSTSASTTRPRRPASGTRARPSANARKAAQDTSTIAYLGEFNSGASAISIPILNEAGILQISPSNTYVGLTRSEGADKGEPDKYYPSGKRTFGRVVPADHIQAAAQVTYQKDQGCKKTYILNDKEVYGKGIADQVEKLGKAQGLAIAGNDGIDTKAANFRSLAAEDQVHAAPTACSSAASRRTRASSCSRTSTPPTRR